MSRWLCWRSGTVLTRHKITTWKIESIQRHSPTQSDPSDSHYFFFPRYGLTYMRWDVRITYNILGFYLLLRTLYSRPGVVSLIRHISLRGRIDTSKPEVSWYFVGRRDYRGNWVFIHRWPYTTKTLPDLQIWGVLLPFIGGTRERRYYKFSDSELQTIGRGILIWGL